MGLVLCCLLAALSQARPGLVVMLAFVCGLAWAMPPSRLGSGARRFLSRFGASTATPFAAGHLQQGRMRAPTCAVGDAVSPGAEPSWRLLGIVLRSIR